MKIRKSTTKDQEHTEKAYRLLLDLIQKHQAEIEPALWVGAMVAALANNCQKSEVPFEFFKDMMTKCVDHYFY